MWNSVQLSAQVVIFVVVGVVVIAPHTVHCTQGIFGQRISLVHICRLINVNSEWKKDLQPIASRRIRRDMGGKENRLHRASLLPG